MAYTYLVSIINNYSAPISYSDTESKGVDIKSIPSDDMGNPQSPPVPWFYPINKIFSNHHMVIASSDGKFTYYIWQYKNNVRFSATQPSNGDYDAGSVLLDQVGCNFFVTMASNGDLSATEVDNTTFINLATNYYEENEDFITGMANALSSFITSAAGSAIISSMNSNLSVLYPLTTNYAQQALATSQFSYLMPNLSGGSGLISGLNFNSFSLGVNCGAAAVVGVEASIEVNFAPSTKSLALTVTGTALIGVSAEVEISVVAGVSNSFPTSSWGVTYGVVFSIASVQGFQAAVFFDSSLNFSGFSVAAVAGEGGMLCFAISTNAVIISTQVK